MNQVILEKSFKDEELGAYVLQFEHEGWAKFRLYARLKQATQEVAGTYGRFAINHGKPWDRYTGNKLDLAQWPELRYAMQKAYAIAHATLNGLKPEPKQQELPLIVDGGDPFNCKAGV